MVSNIKQNTQSAASDKWLDRLGAKFPMTRKCLDVLKASGADSKDIEFIVYQLHESFSHCKDVAYSYYPKGLIEELELLKKEYEISPPKVDPSLTVQAKKPAKAFLFRILGKSTTQVDTSPLHMIRVLTLCNYINQNNQADPKSLSEVCDIIYELRGSYAKKNKYFKAVKSIPKATTKNIDKYLILVADAVGANIALSTKALKEKIVVPKKPVKNISTTKGNKKTSRRERIEADPLSFEGDAKQVLPVDWDRKTDSSGCFEEDTQWVVDYNKSEFSVENISPETTVEVSEEKRAANRRRVTRWIDSVQSVSMNHSNNWNEIERDQFIQRLMEMLEESSEEKRWLGTIMGLCYFTSQPISTVLNWSYGNSGEISTQGVYQRKYELPPSIYTPSGSAVGNHTLSDDSIDLLLPGILCSQFDEVFRYGAKLHSGFLSKVSDVEHEVKVSLNEWSEHRRYRLFYDRLFTQLRNQVSIISRNAFYVFILCGSEAHANPNINYYVAASKSRLIDVWSAAQSNLLESGH